MHGRTATTLAALTLLVVAAPASAANFTVTRFDDPANAACALTVCDSLRAAVAAANTNAKDADIIQLDMGTYTLQQAAALPLSSPITITGVSARRTIIQGNGGTRVMTQTNAPVTIQQLTVQGGRETTAAGGNILNTGGTLNLFRVRFADGQAAGGAGLANQGGTVTISDSLIDHNTAPSGAIVVGGGLYNAGTSSPAGAVVPGRVTITNSTIAFNSIGAATGRLAARGGGIYNDNDTSTTTLQDVTVARNTAAAGATGAGLYDASTTGNVGGISSSASIVAGNLVDGAEANCFHSLPIAQPSANLEGPPASCGFANVADPQFAAALSDQGGYTDVLTIAATSPAKGLAPTCPFATDQRDAPRSAPCDVGAFEEGVTAPVIDPIDTGPGPQPQPQPSPTPTPSPAPPTPVFHKTVVIKPVSGKVRIKLKGSNKFVTLTSADDIPLGSTIDVKAGKIQLTSVPKPDGAPQTATFFGGIFKITQPGGTTDLRLTEGLAACSRRGHASAAKAKKKKPKTRHLWGQGSGAFRTTGRYSAATVRGTKWLVRDSCSGTLTRVTQGVVNVRDKVRHKTIVVRAGHRYTARPKKKRK